MVLYSYANEGYRKYRLKPGETACEECKERGKHTYSIGKFKDAEVSPLVHPNCRCTVQILDDKNKAVATIDSEAVEEQLGKTESTKEMGFLDYVSALLSAAALIPGIDSIVDLISIPVDLLRGDLASVGFDLVGIIPVIGEVGDTGKALRIADKAIDGTKAAKTAEKMADGIQGLSKQKRGTPRNNKAQNRQTDSIAKRLKLTAKERRELHDLIHKQNLGYQEILELSKEWFNK